MIFNEVPSREVREVQEVGWNLHLRVGDRIYICSLGIPDASLLINTKMSLYKLTFVIPESIDVCTEENL
jgi:hypothetical protein